MTIQFKPNSNEFIFVYAKVKAKKLPYYHICIGANADSDAKITISG